MEAGKEYNLRSIYEVSINSAVSLTNILTLGSSNIKKYMRQSMWHIRGRREVHTEILWGNVRERDNLEPLDIDGEGNIKLDLIEIR
jgi:hypothetical protein